MADRHPDRVQQSFMIGVLVDVSGSMEEAFALDRSVSGKVKRTHAIITTLNKIAKNAIAVHQQSHRIRMFAEAFGLEDTSTCDLISLLKYTSRFNPSKKATEDELECARKDKSDDDHDRSHLGSNGTNVMIKFAADRNAPHAERWIRKALSEPEAGVLYTILSRDEELTKQFVEQLPGNFTSTLLDATSTVFGRYGDVSLSTVEESELYKLVHKAINRFAIVTAHLKQPQIQKPSPQPVKEVSDLLDELLDTTRDSSSQSTSESSTTIRRLFDHIKPFIFGGTPMKKALEHAKEIFDRATVDQKVLFILSDGSSADGDPFPIAEELRKSNVTIITCFLTSNPITQSKRLLYTKDPAWKDPRWDKGVLKLFDMSSNVHNTEIPVTYFIDAKWELPTEGESRLFLQANSLDIVEEFVDIVSTHIKEGRCVDAVATILATVSVATYINVANSEFEPNKQRGKTCYANAIAAVYHLAMRRIEGREGGVPEFSSILQTLTDEYPSKADTKKVLTETCKKYRLHFTELNRNVRTADEIGARNALNQRRPVVATFFLDRWLEFSKFYRNNPKGILEAKDLAVTDPKSKLDPGGHAVVLVRCEPNCLIFMNSWGQKWGDGGFFRVKNARVLPDMRFFDVYWNECDLKPSEIEAFKQKGTDVAKDITKNLISVYNLDYECPKCKSASKVKDYTGHLLEAQCPKCHKRFKPDNDGIMQSLYMNSC